MWISTREKDSVSTSAGFLKKSPFKKDNNTGGDPYALQIYKMAAVHGSIIEQVSAINHSEGTLFQHQPLFVFCLFSLNIEL